MVLCELANKLRAGSCKKVSQSKMPFPQRVRHAPFLDLSLPFAAFPCIFTALPAAGAPSVLWHSASPHSLALGLPCICTCNAPATPRWLSAGGQGLCIQRCRWQCALLRSCPLRRFAARSGEHQEVHRRRPCPRCAASLSLSAAPASPFSRWFNQRWVPADSKRDIGMLVLRLQGCWTARTSSRTISSRNQTSSRCGLLLALSSLSLPPFTVVLPAQTSIDSSIPWPAWPTPNVFSRPDSTRPRPIRC